MRRGRILAAMIAGTAALALQSAAANVDVVREHVPNAEVVGQGRMTYLFWDLYDATLYAPSGEWAADRPYALALDYLRELSGDRIAEVSATEIARIGEVPAAQLNAWRNEMRQVFPDVDATTRLVGVRDATGRTLFYRDAEFLGAINDPKFSTLFFGIWLDEQTSAAALRDALLGLAE